MRLDGGGVTGQETTDCATNSVGGATVAPHKTTLAPKSARSAGVMRLAWCAKTRPVLCQGPQCAVLRYAKTRPVLCQGPKCAVLRYAKVLSVRYYGMPRRVQVCTKVLSLRYCDMPRSSV